MPDIDVGQFSEALNDKADRDLNNTQPLADYVIESKYPTAEDPTWYRLYKSGWVEQGGMFTLTNTIYTTVSLLIEMANNSYFLCATYNDVLTSDGTIRGLNTGGYTTTSFKVKVGVSGSNSLIVWEVKGMAATQT